MWGGHSKIRPCANQETNADGTWSWTSIFQNCEKIHVCGLVEPLRLWGFVVVTLADEPRQSRREKFQSLVRRRGQGTTPAWSEEGGCFPHGRFRETLRPQHGVSSCHSHPLPPLLRSYPPLTWCKKRNAPFLGWRRKLDVHVDYLKPHKAISGCLQPWWYTALTNQEWMTYWTREVFTQNSCSVKGKVGTWETWPDWFIRKPCKSDANANMFEIYKNQVFKLLEFLSI